MEKSNLFLVLGGLLILALILASAARRYQELMAERRMRIKRILRGVDRVRDLLQSITGCPLPQELQRVLLQDVVARFQMVKQIDARYQGVDALITEAEQAGNQVLETQRFDIQDNQQLQRITQALGELIEFLRNGSLMTPLRAEQAERHIELTGARRAESVYRYHMEQAKKLQEEDQLNDALGHCNSIKTFLNRYGPANVQVKTWFAEAEEMGKELSEAIDASTPAT